SLFLSYEFHYKKSEFSRRRKTSGEVKNTSGKELPTQSSASGQTSSRDRLSRRCVGHASDKPLPKQSFPTQSTTPDAMYCVGKASPDRLYRTALLRNRFADTILKAREKHLKRFVKLEIFLVCPMLGQPYDAQTHTYYSMKGDKRDPEKVRMEREELERQQRERWRRATDGGRLKLKLQSRRRTTMTMEETTASYGQRRMFLSSPNSFPFVFSSV
uniref:Uncharacterized protein n=1 Tax=Cucumis melo TaxID=3656 RepID=A0A9I9EA41_CUCME